MFRENFTNLFLAFKSCDAEKKEIAINIYCCRLQLRLFLDISFA